MLKIIAPFFIFLATSSLAQEPASAYKEVAPVVANEPAETVKAVAKPKRKAKVAVKEPVYADLPPDMHPTLSPDTPQNIRKALGEYNEIASQGGWGELKAATQNVKPKQASDLVLALKTRLYKTRDLDEPANNIYDQALTKAIMIFQRRHGLAETGRMNAPTLKALNIPVEKRIEAMEYSLSRLSQFKFQFDERYVVVNIPSAEVELIENGEVKRRHLAIVGKPERATPLVETKLTVVNLNPTWTVPTSIIKKDMIPKMQKDPQALAKMRIRILDRNGEEVNPASINWSTEKAVNYTLRQDAGANNSLGQIRIDMPNTEAVFMHDTPSKKLFKGERRFHSSGCVRVEHVKDFAAWLLAPQGLGRDFVDNNLKSTARKDIRLTKAVPVAWVYLTGWAEKDGRVHFRDDIYGFDTPNTAEIKVARAPQRKTAVVSDEPAPPPPPQIEDKSLVDIFFWTRKK